MARAERKYIVFGASSVYHMATRPFPVESEGLLRARCGNYGVGVLYTNEPRGKRPCKTCINMSPGPEREV